MSKRPASKKKLSRTQILWRRWGDWRKLAIALLTGCFLAALLTVPLLPDKVRLQVGEVARDDIVAPRSARYQDPRMTERLRKLTADQVPRRYSTILNANADSRDRALGFFQALEAQRAAAATLSEGQRAAALQKRGPGPDFPLSLARKALHLSPTEAGQAGDAVEDLLRQATAAEILPENLEEVRAGLRKRAAGLPLSAPAREVAGEVAARSLQPNRFYNAQETEEARQRERERVPTQYATIKRGDLVVRRGEVVTEGHRDALEALGLLRPNVEPVTAASLILLAFGLVGVFCLFLYQFHPRILRSLSDLVLLAVVVCACMLLFRIGSTALGLRYSGEQLGFLGMVCSALGAMLIAALLCPQVAVFVGVALALLTSVLVGSELKFAILSIVSSLVGVQAVSTIRNRAGILRAGLTVAAVNVVTALVAHGATQASPPDEIGQNALWAALGGFLTVALFFFFAAWLERPFRVTTHLTLLELSDPSHPLLRRLAMEAPGTYHHSIVVGNLAEAAAEAIGADGLFCRVASYYHDVGKVIRPQFFVENQSADNRHNSINPSLSSLVVASHVKDGVELAEEHRLPPPIINIIKEHHGTCLIKYFYHRAVTAGEDNTPALEYQFRYEGPRPQTKESGIIMIADSSEAASRTLEKPTPGRIRDLIERIVRDRLSDGQLDECELTFKDLEKIISSMTRSLTSVLHARVEYPEGDTSALRRLAADGAAHREPVGAPKALADTPETASAALGGPPGG